MSQIKINQFLNAIFSRNSVATNLDGSQVTANSPRYASGGIFIEEGTTNLFAAPSAPVQEEIAVTQNGDYAISLQPTSSASGYTVEHKHFTDTQADFNSGTLVGVTALSSGAIALDVQADPTFTRASVATQRNGTTAASGAIRYENTVDDVVFNTGSAFDQGIATGAISSGNVLTLPSDPSFARTSIAYLLDGTQVASGTPRLETIVKQIKIDSYEDFAAGTMDKVYPTPDGKITIGQIFDDFNVNSSYNYTLGGDATAGAVMTFNTSSGRLETLTTGGADSITYVYNNFSAKDVAAEINISQAGDSGIIARYQDNNNYYLMQVKDASASPANAVYFFKRVGGTFTQISTVTIPTFIRGTTHTARLEVVGTSLKAYFDGSLVLSATDSSISAAGKIGLRTNGTTANYYNSFTIDTLTPMFSRASSGSLSDLTVVSNEVMRYSAANLIKTDDFSNSEYTKGNLTITGNQTSPIGTTDAWMLTDNATNSTHLLYGSYLTMATVPASISVYAKAGTMSTFVLALNDITRAQFDLSTQTISATNGAVTGSITSAGGGWYRCTLSTTSVGAFSGNVLNGARFMVFMNSYGSYVGTGKTLYLWHPQVELGSNASVWSAAGNSAVMVEEGTTNIVTQSEAFDNAAWTKFNSTVTANTVAAPNGTSTADSLVEDTTTNEHCLTTSFTKPAVSTTYTASVYAKANTRTSIRLFIHDGSGNGFQGYYDLSAGTVVNSLTSGTGVSVIGASIQPVGNGWYRCVISGTTNTATNVEYRVSAVNGSGQVTYLGNGSGVYLWGAQFETKSYVTTYIPTSGSSVTRSAELLEIPASGVINPTAGTIVMKAYCDGDASSSTSATNHILFHTRDVAGNSNEFILFRPLGGSSWTLRSTNASTTTSTLTSSVSAANTVGWHTYAIRWSSDEISFWCDGVKRMTITTPNLPTTLTNPLVLGSHAQGGQNWNSPIDSFAAFNIALSDADMALYTSSGLVSADTRLSYYTEFAGNTNYKTNGSWTSPWLDSNAPGMNIVWDYYVPSGIVSAGNSVVDALDYTFRAAPNSDGTGSDAYAIKIAGKTGRYIQANVNLHMDGTTTNKPFVDSIIMSPSASGYETTVNLFTNPDFEQSATAWGGWVRYDNVTTGTSSTNTAEGTISSADKYTGTYSMLINSANTQFLYQPKGVPANNDVFSISCYAKRVDGSAVTNSTFMPVVSNATSTWDSITSVGNGWYYCKKATTSASSNQNWGFWIIGGNAHYIDNCQIEKRTYVTPYVNGTRNSQAIWVEEGTTNLASYSEDFTNAWWNQRGNVSFATGFISPFFTNKASKMMDDATNNIHYFGVNAPLTQGQPAVMSCYVKSAGRTGIRLALDYLNQYANFDLTTGTVAGVVSASGNVNAGIAKVNNGWYRVWVATDSLSYGIQYTYLLNGINTQYVGDGNGVYIWGMQFEQKRYPTSYLPTSGASVTRNAETVTLPSTLLNPSAGTVIIRAYVDGDAAAATSTNYHMLFKHEESGNANNNIGIYKAGGASTNQWRVYTSNSTGTSSSPTWTQTLSVGWHMFAVRWSASEVSLWVDGAKRAFVTTPNIPVMLNGTTRIGFDSTGNQWNNIIDDVAIFPYALDDATMATYTTI